MAAPRIRNRSLGFLCFFTVAILYGSFGLFIRFLQTELTALQIVTLRSISAAFISLIWAVCKCHRADWRKLSQTRVWGFGLTFPISVLLWTIAVTYGTVRVATFGLCLGSLLASAVLGWKFYSERLTQKDILSLLLGLVGALIFSLPFENFSEISRGLLLGICAGTVQAFNLCYRRWLGDISRPLVLAVQGLGGLCVCLILSLIFSPSVPDISGGFIGIGILFGAVIVLVSYLLLIGSMNLELNKGSIILSTELIWVTLMAAAFLGEIPTMEQVAGCILLFTALFIARFDGFGGSKQ